MIINGKGFRASLQQFMRNADLTPAEIGKLVGATPKTVQSWLAGKHDPKKEHYVKLVETYREFVTR